MSPYNNAPFTIKRSKKSNSSRTVFLSFVLIAGIFLIWLTAREILNRTKEKVPPIYPDVARSAFMSKRALMSRVAELETTVNSYDARLSELTVLKDENEKLKAELNRPVEPRGTLAHVLTIPNRSLYDTLAIDAGTNDGIVVGATAYAFGNIALGTVSYAGLDTSTVSLFSAPGRETPGTAAGSDVAVTLIGRGGGEYEVRMPRDVHFDIGSMIANQSVNTSTLAQIEKVSSDPRDPFQRLLAKAPINLQALKWVTVR